MKNNILFSQHFKIQSDSIEFFDIPLLKDKRAFICPFLIANNRDVKLINEVYNRITQFLTKLNRDYVVTGDRINGLNFLSHLHEANEYHLGYSGSNKGKAVSNFRAATIYDALQNNKFAVKGISITNEAHNVLLLVKGIGQDIMSDILANVCRDIFADYTKQVCDKYSVSTYSFKIEYFDASTNKWQTKECSLPMFNGKKIILLPRKLACSGRAYHSLYNWFIASNYIARDLLNFKLNESLESGLLHKLEDGTIRAVVKKINGTYRKPKQELIDFVIRYNGSIDRFLNYSKDNYFEAS
ncbi:hypothetical protein DBR32_12010 [Taibaiella sp. KBW10]|uniref:hypothetical protein n=1 Tax=Taibaiella sp. KBW10 TaxID=2153357 RepID=UPI000F5B07A3|nr:hypothetical protein [Taibaiella sp. KBW10]RQO30292.1 hypothetical protein DBR32_12010 [Taibaiella sp. KBW10]